MKTVVAEGSFLPIRGVENVVGGYFSVFSCDFSRFWRKSPPAGAKYAAGRAFGTTLDASTTVSDNNWHFPPHPSFSSRSAENFGVRFFSLPFFLSCVGRLIAALFFIFCDTFYLKNLPQLTYHFVYIDDLNTHIHHIK